MVILTDRIMNEWIFKEVSESCRLKWLMLRKDGVMSHCHFSLGSRNRLRRKAALAYSLLSALSFHSADTCKDFWCGVMTEYHNTDIRLIGQDNLLSVLVGIKPKPLLFPSLVFLPKYSKLLLANRKVKNKIRCIMLVSGEEEMGGRISVKR